MDPDDEEYPVFITALGLWVSRGEAEKETGPPHKPPPRRLLDSGRPSG